MAKDKKRPPSPRRARSCAACSNISAPHVSLVVLSLALCLINVALTLYVPILVGRAVDCIVGPNAVDFAAPTPILMTIAVRRHHGGGAVGHEHAAQQHHLMTPCAHIRRNAFAHIQNLPLSYLDAHPTGDTVSRMIADVDTFADGLLMGFTQLFRAS